MLPPRWWAIMGLTLRRLILQSVRCVSFLPSTWGQGQAFRTGPAVGSCRFIVELRDWIAMCFPVCIYKMMIAWGRLRPILTVYVLFYIIMPALWCETPWGLYVNIQWSFSEKNKNKEMRFLFFTFSFHVPTLSQGYRRPVSANGSRNLRRKHLQKLDLF